MLILLSSWQEVRDDFTPKEKELMNAAILGQVACPRGIKIDEDALPAALRDKIRQYFPHTRQPRVKDMRGGV